MNKETVIALAQEAHGAMLASGRGMYLWHGDALAGDVQDFCERFAVLAYERGFVDGMSEQAKRSVDKAVNRMAEPRPIQECYGDCPTNPQTCPNPCNFEGRPKPEQKSWFTVEELNDFATKLKEKAWKA